MDDLPELRGGSLIARSRRHEGHEKSITGSTEVIDRSISRPHIKRNALQWDEHLDDDEFSAGSNDRFIAGATRTSLIESVRTPQGVRTGDMDGQVREALSSYIRALGEDHQFQINDASVSHQVREISRSRLGESSGA